MSGRLEAHGIERPPMLKPATLSVQAGEIVGLVGPNGSGKTTLLRAIVGLTRGSGAVSCDGRDLRTLGRNEQARRIAYLPAIRRVGWPMLARDLVALGLLPFGGGSAEAVDAALEAVDALAFADRPMDRLSTGEAARVLLARTLVGRPGYLLLDEPIANLDARHQLSIMEMLRREAARGAGLLVVLHDLPLAERFCDRLVLLDSGEIIAAGAPRDVLTADRLATVFGIRRGSDGWEAA